MARTGFNEGFTDDDQEVTVVPRPSVGTRRNVSLIQILNQDTAGVTVKVRRWDETRQNFDDEYLNLIEDQTLGEGERLVLNGNIRTLNSDQMIVVELTSQVTTNQPEFYASWFDEVG